MSALTKLWARTVAIAADHRYSSQWNSVAGFMLVLVGLTWLCSLLGGSPPERVKPAALGQSSQSQGQRHRELWGRLIDWTQGTDGRPLVTLETADGEQLTMYVADTAKVGYGLVGQQVKVVGTYSPSGLFVVDTELTKAKTLTAVSWLTKARVKGGIAVGSGITGSAQDLPDGIHLGRFYANEKKQLVFVLESPPPANEEEDE